MDIGEAIALVSIVGGAALVGLLVAGAWALGRVHERRDALSRGGGPDVVAQRLDRIERLLDTLSTDVERLLEARRGPLLGAADVRAPSGDTDAASCN